MKQRRHMKQSPCSIELLHREAYFNFLNKLDLQSRAYKTTQDALHDYINKLRKPTPTEEINIHLAIKYADNFMKLYPKLAKLPWKVFVGHELLESGFPHTHHDTIVLPPSYVQKMSASLINTLIHEKIHIFQRFYPCETNVLYIDYWGLTIKKVIDHNPNNNVRSNPDTNQLVYQDNGNDIVARYLSLTEPQLSKTTGDLRDHPHEMMAYIITSILSKSSIINQQLKRHVASTEEWMNIFMT